MTWSFAIEILISFLLLIGSLFTLVAAFGLLKLRGPMARLHAPTKSGTIGVGAFLLASMFASYLYGEGSAHELLIMGFIFLTAPVSANFIARVNIHNQVCEGVIPTLPSDENWSTLNYDEEENT